MKKKRALQCLDRCPICDVDQSGIKSTGFMHHTRKTPFPDYKDVRCLGGRGHDGLHQCKKHSWGTLKQRGIDLENVSGNTGRYIKLDYEKEERVSEAAKRKSRKSSCS